MIVESHQQGSADWLQARAGVITASRFSDAIGVLERASRLGQVGDPSGESVKYAWTIAMERVAGKPLDQTFVTWQMRRGTELEPRAREAYEVRTGALVEESGIAFTDDRKFGYSTDGFIESDGMCEIKCPSACDKLGLIWTHPEDAHLEYIDQINGGLWITGRKWCDLVVYCDWLAPVGKDLFIKRIYRDDNAIEALESSLWAFEQRVSRHEAAMRAPVQIQPLGAMKRPPAARALAVSALIPLAAVTVPADPF